MPVAAFRAAYTCPMKQISFASGHLVLPLTPLVDSPVFAKRCGVARVLVKLECNRPLGNFKVLGGLPAALHGLARVTGISFGDLAGGHAPKSRLPALLCASAGNHGLAVAAAAKLSGADAIVFLHRNVEPYRVRRIERMGATIVRVDGTYDDAVDAAYMSAAERGILVPDTSRDGKDPAVADVMDGYRLIAREIAGQLERRRLAPTHLFLQAGVGGLAASVAEGLCSHVRSDGRFIVVEPDGAACVGQALLTERSRIGAPLDTGARMLACGEASVPALAILRGCGAIGMTVTDADMNRSIGELWSAIGIRTTMSGAASLAGLLRAAGDPVMRHEHGLDAESVAVVIVTEGTPARSKYPSSWEPSPSL